MRTILFICTGNTCRSPMAEAVAQRWIDEGHLIDKPLAVSAGVAAGTGVPPSTEIAEALADVGCAFDGKSKPLTAEMVRAAHVVFAMTVDHLEAARALVQGEPDQLEKILPLDPDGDVPDPIGMSQASYDGLARHFSELIPKRLQEVFADEDRAGVGSSRP